ncbi:hypothetical protein DESUT3_37570 [Desulfuromonas versatilis]|uniref:Lipoprotein n=1 Tax=Desulfuromonas versatilis TaxID=2802975 RepID=A0ABN6E2Y7_9BACT|nr:hypothetical protein [Desulfuromonas versatilis]BCR06688.1 hypothetical protein DESUT3_37570 [Desulfuromonas versatilis]
MRILIYGVLLLSLLVGCAGNKDALTESTDASLGAKNEGIRVEEDLGLEVIGMRWTAAGNMLDFRWRAIDPIKAEILFSRKDIPYLIHQNSGAKFLVPNAGKVGPLRQTTNKPVAGKSYFIFFANPGKYVKRGDKVTIVVGDHQIRDLVVE